MTAISCAECCELIDVRFVQLNVVANGHVQSFCSNTCLLAWAAEREVQGA